MPLRPSPPGRPRARAVDLPSGALVESAAVVAHAQQRAPDERQLDVHAARAGVLGDVGEALLRHAEDHELLLVGQRRERARGGGSARACRCAAPKSETCDASAAISPWSSSAVGRSWRASASSSSIAWLTSSWVSCSSERRPQGASPIVAERRSRIAVSAWLTSSWRSCAMRLRSCSCARRTARPDSRRSTSSRVEHAVERVGQHVQLARGAARRLGALARAGEVDGRHRARRAGPSAPVARAAAAS